MNREPPSGATLPVSQDEAAPDRKRREIARNALERVCVGNSGDAAMYYAPSFIDHVNDRVYEGLAGVQRSVESYRKMFDSMSIAVEQQHVAGEFVTSRFVAVGLVRGRAVRFNGVTISKIEGHLIVEDWSVIDTLGMLRQLGPLRLALIIIRSVR
jgi:predicted ester cyclase